MHQNEICTLKVALFNKGLRYKL